MLPVSLFAIISCISFLPVGFILFWLNLSAVFSREVCTQQALNFYIFGSFLLFELSDCLAGYVSLGYIIFFLVFWSYCYCLCASIAADKTSVGLIAVPLNIVYLFCLVAFTIFSPFSWCSVVSAQCFSCDFGFS